MHICSVACRDTAAQGSFAPRAHTGHCHEVFSAMQPFLPAVGQICVTPLASKDAGEEAEVTGHLPCGGGCHSLSSLKESPEEKNVSIPAEDSDIILEHLTVC